MNFLLRVGSERNGTKRNYNFYFLSLSLFQPILARNDAIMDFYHFFIIFLLIFLEFSITRRVGTKRNGNFYFHHSSAFSNLFWLAMNPQWYLLILWFFFSFFGIFYYLSGKNGTKRKFLFFHFLGFFQPIFAWNEAITVSFNSFNFFAIFFEFSLTRRIGMKRNDNFYFLSSSTFSTLFWLQKKP